LPLCRTRAKNTPLGIGWVAQLVEQRTENPSGEGRTPFQSVSLRLTKIAFNPVFIGDSHLWCKIARVYRCETELG
jgi:hypothetical protein